MIRPAFALFVSLRATTGPLAALACGESAGPEAPSSYDVTVTPRGPDGVPARFTGTNAGYVVALIPIDERQTMWSSILTIRLLKSDAPVAVFVVVFPDTAVQFGRFEIWHAGTKPRPAGAVTIGHVVPANGAGIREIESGQLELAEGPSGVVEGSFTAQLLRVPIGGIDGVEADAGGAVRRPSPNAMSSSGRSSDGAESWRTVAPRNRCGRLPVGKSGGATAGARFIGAVVAVLG